MVGRYNAEPVLLLPHSADFRYFPFAVQNGLDGYASQTNDDRRADQFDLPEQNRHGLLTFGIRGVRLPGGLTLMTFVT